MKPEIGTRPDFDSIPIVHETGDPVLIVMTEFVALLEENPSSNYVQYPQLVGRVQRQGMSRLFFDEVITNLLTLEYVYRVQRMNGYLMLGEQGRQYALENKLA